MLAMKYFTKEVKIALVAIAGVVVLFFGMNFLKGLNIFSSEDNYYVQFSDITGLSSSSPVYADGFKVGVVKDIIYDYSHTEGSKVLIGVDKQLRIPQGSSAEIVSDTLHLTFYDRTGSNRFHIQTQTGLSLGRIGRLNSGDLHAIGYMYSGFFYDNRNPGRNDVWSGDTGNQFRSAQGPAHGGKTQAESPYVPASDGQFHGEPGQSTRA